MATTDKNTENSSSPNEQKPNNNDTFREGYNLLGSPTFVKLDNGRFKCVETGHETLPKDKDAYVNSKRCRLGLIDTAISQKKPPLNMFKQDPNCKLKVVCKLTGDIVNKSEEHIWKHLNGKRFLNKLEQKELEKLGPMKMEVEEKPEKVVKENGDGGNKDKKKKDRKMKDRKMKEKKKKEKISVVDKETIREKETSDDGSESEEPEFWAPPVGSRWDFDNGKDRWGSDTESEHESDDGSKLEKADGENGVESAELTMRTKRMSIEIGPSSFAPRKKKSKTKSSGDSSIV